MKLSEPMRLALRTVIYRTDEGYPSWPINSKGTATALERRELVKVEQILESRKYYRATAAGRAAVKEAGDG
ncbi:MAG: hypothetical protein GY906_24120 [bacterium]|nr:hypothetical protein [bacterium]